MGLFSRMFAGRAGRAEPPARVAKRRAAAPARAKAAPRSAGSATTGTKARNPVYKHAGCPINHRTLEAVSGCRNR